MSYLDFYVRGFVCFLLVSKPLFAVMELDRPTENELNRQLGFLTSKKLADYTLRAKQAELEMELPSYRPQLRISPKLEREITDFRGQETSIRLAGLKAELSQEFSTETELSVSYDKRYDLERSGLQDFGQTNYEVELSQNIDSHSFGARREARVQLFQKQTENRVLEHRQDSAKLCRQTLWNISQFVINRKKFDLVQLEFENAKTLYLQGQVKYDRKLIRYEDYLGLKTQFLLKRGVLNREKMRLMAKKQSFTRFESLTEKTFRDLSLPVFSFNKNNNNEDFLPLDQQKAKNAKTIAIQQNRLSRMESWTRPKLFIAARRRQSREPSSQGLTSFQEDRYEIGVRFDIPFSNSYNRNSIKRATHRAMVAQLESRILEKSRKDQLQREFAKVNELKRLKTKNQETIGHFQNSVKYHKSRFLKGAIPIENLINAHKLLNHALIEDLGIQAEILESEFQIAKLNGDLDQKCVQLIDQLK